VAVSATGSFAAHFGDFGLVGMMNGYDISQLAVSVPDWTNLCGPHVVEHQHQLRQVVQRSGYVMDQPASKSHQTEADHRQSSSQQGQSHQSAQQSSLSQRQPQRPPPHPLKHKVFDSSL
jgi:hypothetical protein